MAITTDKATAVITSLLPYQADHGVVTKPERGAARVI